MQTFNEIIKDPDFINLSPEAKIKVLDVIDDDFKNKNINVKSAIVQKLSLEKPDESNTALNQVPEWGRENPNLYGAYGAGKEVYEQVGKPGLEATGAVAGSLMGRPLGPKFQAYGAGLGYGVAKKGTEVVDNLLRKIEGKKEIDSELFLKQLLDESWSSFKDFSFGLGAESGGESAGKIIEIAGQKLFAPFAKKITPVLKQLAEEAKKRGISFTPTEITDSKTLGLFESLMEKLPGSSDIIRQFRIEKQLNPLLNNLNKLRDRGASKEQIEQTGAKVWDSINEALSKEKNLTETQLNSLRDNIVKKYGINEPKSIVGGEIQETLTKATQTSKDMVNKAYNAVGEEIPPGEFETKNLTETAKKILNEKSKLAAQDSKMMQHLKWASGEDIPPETLAQLDALPSNVREELITEISHGKGKEWSTINDFIKEMNALSSKEDALKMAAPGMKYQQTPEGAVYNELKSSANKDLEEIAEKTGSKAYQKLQEAKALYGKEAEIYKSDEIRKIAKANPEDVIPSILKPNGITEINLVKKAIGEKGFERVKQGVTNHLLGADKEVFDPKFLERQLSKYGDDVLKEIYGEPIVSELKIIAKNGLDLTKQKPGTTFLKSLLKKDPDVIVDAIIGAPESKLASNNLHSNYKAVKNILSVDEKKAIQERFFEKLIQRHPELDTIQPVKFAKMIDKYEERLPGIFPQKKVNEIRQLADIAYKFGKAEGIAGNPSGTSQTMMAGYIGRQLMFQPVKGTILALAPKQISKLYLSDSGIQWLGSGFKIPAGTQEANALAAKIIAIMDKDEKETQNARSN